MLCNSPVFLLDSLYFSPVANRGFASTTFLKLTLLNQRPIQHSVTAQKMKFSIKNFFSKFDQICSFLRIWSHLLKRSLMENFIFCAVCQTTLVKLFSENWAIKPETGNYFHIKPSPQKNYALETWIFLKMDSRTDVLLTVN